MTINMAATRADDRRLMVNCDREEEAIKNESISSYETVKYFNAEKYELERYVDAIKAYQKAEYKVTWGMNMMNICQALVFQTGLLAIMTLAAYEVAHGKRDVGDFVTITTYMNQLQGPLNFFGTFYRTVQQALVSGERLLELFKVKPTVVDRVIEIDGHDVKDVTIDSVRRHIGVVPQDTALFNESLMYNLKYGNPSVSDEEVYEACRAASIHDRILSFQDGYDTKVGERGLRLSGGEKQRVAIARTMLKKPKIIMLDEATSALDSETEQQIQSELITGQLGNDRTLLIIAHRLSTITHADQIIVLHAGEIVERGTHSELLAAGGKYASMWEKQHLVFGDPSEHA
ncbi:putative heavy metal tolerance protein [Phaeoacremonium minimum UCRPA7]|uniref:Putative heavy metal tolerance protein n=1 Tax=Phaeoacremonium minimum (strain UCR-PA7) TaxID=1286976 RepID=R8BEL9_PHAM7|nr:putative heavy metal tolerance protein [Phaeoacremonium minimum UCRPA7]EON97746.1 putative heavy metal tolerance protein [Phaeoacremonium minimum UCRPA7]